MKKIFFCLVIAFMAICANAQTSWNVRMGYGLQRMGDAYGDNYYYEQYGVLANYGYGTLTVETNIPLKRSSYFTFSPSLSINLYRKEGDILGMMLPLHFGYKMFLGENLMFCPKLGPTIGFIADYELFYGPSIELPFEYKHFVVALQAQALINDETFFGAALTFGYKF